jgi:hypothetical protein
LFEELNRIIQFKKIVIFIDEFDGIPLKELGNFLTSLRKLYQKYKKLKSKALYSVGLVGIRDITKLVVGGVSPFNIADQVILPPFSLENIRGLYAQYSEETNQPFTAGAVKKVYEETAGQPWLVNRFDDINGILDEGITRLSEKYLATEAAVDGYLVIFDTRTPVGTSCKSRLHQVKDRTVTSLIISIGRSE